MTSLSQFMRLIHIHHVLMRYRLDGMLFAIPFFTPFRFLQYANPYRWVMRTKRTQAERIRLALEELGPIFIKAGQIASTRRDLLPDDVANELSKLQDKVPPFSGELAKQQIEDSLGVSIDSIFCEFNTTALASASIAQVHAATLLDGRDVVVKVLRPQIKKQLDRDLTLLASMAKLINRYSKEARRFKPKEMIDEITHTLYDEIDLMREGANASQLQRNFKGSSLLRVPTIYWQYSHANVLVMERMYGTPIYDVAALKAAGYNMKKLAERGVEIFFTQVFRDSFFHADMHPGNIFVAKDDKQNPTVIAVDFGIVGSLTTKDQRYLAENMLAFFKRDYQRVAELHVESGWLPSDTRIDLFESVIRSVCEPIFERPLKDISFGQLLLRLFQAARRFNINIQPQLILLQKTLLNVEGVGRQLYPDLDLWTTASPYLEKWLRNQVGVKGFVRRIRDNLPFWSEKLPEIPGLLYDVLKDKREKRAMPLCELVSRQQPPAKQRKLAWFYAGLGLAFIASGVMLWCIEPDANRLAYSLLGVGGMSWLGVFIKP